MENDEIPAWMDRQRAVDQIGPEGMARLEERTRRVTKVYDAARAYKLEEQQMRFYALATKDQTAEDVIAQMQRDIEGIPGLEPS